MGAQGDKLTPVELSSILSYAVDWLWISYATYDLLRISNGFVVQLVVRKISNKSNEMHGNGHLDPARHSVVEDCKLVPLHRVWAKTRQPFSAVSEPTFTKFVGHVEESL